MSEHSADVPENWEQIKEVAAVLAKTADYGTGVTVTEFAQAEAVLNHLHSSQPTREQIAEAQGRIDRHMQQIAHRVMDVFENADEDALAEDIQSDIYAAIGLAESFGAALLQKGADR